MPLGVSLALVGDRRPLAAPLLRDRDPLARQTGGGSTSAHFGVYDFIPNVLLGHPLFGLGFNNFSVYYEFVTGKTNWGPHSFYVALLVETGLVGAAVFVAFLWYLFHRLQRRARSAARWRRRAIPAAARLRPLAWGLTAALVGTLVANAFYLTMTFYYFYVLAMFALACPLVFAWRLHAPVGSRRGSPSPVAA